MISPSLCALPSAPRSDFICCCCFSNLLRSFLVSFGSAPVVVVVAAAATAAALRLWLGFFLIVGASVAVAVASKVGLCSSISGGSLVLRTFIDGSTTYA